MCIPVEDAVVGISTKSAGGISTASITCITPLDVRTSAIVTIAPETVTELPDIEIVKSSPFNAVAVIPSDKSVDITCPATT